MEDNFLGESFLKIEKQHQAVLDAKEIERTSNAKLLFDFMKVAENDILPIFYSMEENYRDKITDVKVLNHLIGSVSEIIISFSIYPCPYPKSVYSLSIRANLNRFEIIVSGEVDHQSKVHKALAVSQLNSEIVKRSLCELIEAKKD